MRSDRVRSQPQTGEASEQAVSSSALPRMSVAEIPSTEQQLLSFNSARPLPFGPLGAWLSFGLA
jgi:hypothetical protein